MPQHLAKSLQRAASRIQAEAHDALKLPSETQAPADQPVLPHSLFKGTRGYIETVVYQINTTYGSTCYDACAVMIRRLSEVLIIECFEHHGISQSITNLDGDYLYLGELIRLALAEPAWTLSRNTKAGLKKLKTIGDLSAHSRRYNARRQYIDDIIGDLRTVSEELLYLSGLRT